MKTETPWANQARTATYAAMLLLVEEIPDDMAEAAARFVEVAKAHLDNDPEFFWPLDA